jgi:hypothetical protein
MNKPTEDKTAENTITSEQPAQVSEKPSAQGELNEEELKKVAGGTIGSQSSGAGSGKITFNPF